jgi:hypothetical protein
MHNLIYFNIVEAVIGQVTVKALPVAAFTRRTVLNFSLSDQKHT